MPGYTAEVLNALKIKMELMKTKNKELICGLIIDEMYIEQNITYF